jgi:hypothetical protein
MLEVGWALAQQKQVMPPLDGDRMLVDFREIAVVGPRPNLQKRFSCNARSRLGLGPTKTEPH